MGVIRGFVRKWIVGRLLLRNPVVFALVWVAARLRRSRRLAREIPLSSVRSRGRVGADFLHRSGLVDEDAAEPRGEIADLDAFARSEATAEATGADGAFDPDAVDPTVRDFCERTADYAFTYRVRWGRGFRLGARLVSPLTSRIEQLNLPGGGAGWRRLHSRFVAVDLPDDPRDDVRGWVRTESDGTCVFLALYGTYEGGTGGGDDAGADADDAGERFVNVAVPLPFCTLSTVLRARNHDGGSRLLGRGTLPGGVEWTTAGEGHPGLYLGLPGLPFRLPMAQRFRVSPATDGANADLAASHEMWLFGLKFLRVDYRMER